MHEDRNTKGVEKKDTNTALLDMDGNRLPITQIEEEKEAQLLETLEHIKREKRMASTIYFNKLERNRTLLKQEQIMQESNRQKAEPDTTRARGKDPSIGRINQVG